MPWIRDFTTTNTKGYFVSSHGPSWISHPIVQETATHVCVRQFWSYGGDAYFDKRGYEPMFRSIISAYRYLLGLEREIMRRIESAHTHSKAANARLLKQIKSQHSRSLAEFNALLARRHSRAWYTVEG
jgi:hypothetical protein